MCYFTVHLRDAEYHHFWFRNARCQVGDPLCSSPLSDESFTVGVSRGLLASFLFSLMFLCTVILANTTGLCQVYTHPSGTWSLDLSPKHRKKLFWPELNEFLISMVHAWQIEQMGSVSKHPLWPGGFSCSCTGATHKHTNETLTGIE